MMYIIAHIAVYLVSVLLMSMFTRVLYHFTEEDGLTRPNFVWFVPYLNTFIVCILLLTGAAILVGTLIILLLSSLPVITRWHKEDNKYPALINWFILKDNEDD